MRPTPFDIQGLADQRGQSSEPSARKAMIRGKLRPPPILRFLLACIIFCGIVSSLWCEELNRPTNAHPVSFQLDIVYGDSSEPMHRADLYFPAKLEPHEKLPAVLMIHGGAWTAGDKTYDRVHARALASRGYWVMVINYRLAPQHKFPAQVQDCQRALAWMKEHCDEHRIDIDRFGVWGYSAGGHLAALLSLNPGSDQLAPAVCVSGGTPFDLRTLPSETRVLEGVFGGTPGKLPKVYEQASPIIYVGRHCPPMFLFHGTKDWLVPQQNSLNMKEQLTRFEVPHEYLQVEGKGHLATFIDKDAMEKSFDFLDRYLKVDSTWRNAPIQSK